MYIQVMYDLIMNIEFTETDTAGPALPAVHSFKG